MKKNTICILAVATALTGVQPARAGEKERYLVGGLLGGWILNDLTSHSVHSRSRVGIPVAVARRDSCHHSQPSGRYEYRRVKTWIPGRYERMATHCGRVETRWVPGHYDYCTEKVWVSHGSSHSRSHGRRR